MKLAQALLERADLQKRAMQLDMRLAQNARVQEGEKPAEDPELLFKELETVLATLESLITKINLTNAQTLVGGEPLTALLAKRDVLINKVNIYRNFLETASNLAGRMSKTEIIVKSTLSVSQLQKKTDDISKELRELDLKIQEINWTTELI